MHDFKYCGIYLYAEDLRLIDLAKKIGTPAYVYSQQSFYNHFSKLNMAFKTIPHLICYSLKANSNLSILKLLAEWGAGADIVSGGELYRALYAGIKPEQIVYAGVGKREEEIAYALRKDILLFNVESLPELDLINKVALSLGKIPEVCLRINPDISPHTHRYLTTSNRETKFGLTIPQVLEIFSQSSKWTGIHLVGLHLHLGSQITEVMPYEKAIKKIISFIKKELIPRGIDIKYFNIGGGLGIIYRKETPSTAFNFSRKILPLLKDLNIKPGRCKSPKSILASSVRTSNGVTLILEPGRFISGNSGILLTQVLYIKERNDKKFVVVDCGMNDLIRPALYGAYHEIRPLIRKETNKEKVDVVGPICESSDFLAKDRLIEKLHPGDIISIMGAGAYGFTMSSNYNSRPRPPEVLVKGRSFRIVRKRETYKDLIRGEVF